MRALSIAIIFVCIGVAAPAVAFHDSGSFERSSNVGGGGGVFFTGADRWKRYDCSICHTDSTEAVSISLSSSPPGLFSQRQYLAGQTYEISIEMLGETRGLQSGANTNTFVAEIIDGSGRPLRGYQFDSKELSTWSDGRIIGALDTEGRTRWTFSFQSPKAGAGAISFHIAMVDGDGAGSENAASNSAGDDVAVAHLVWCETGVPCEQADLASSDDASAGCSTSGRQAPLWLALFLLTWICLGSSKFVTQSAPVLQHSPSTLASPARPKSDIRLRKPT